MSVTRETLRGGGPVGNCVTGVKESDEVTLSGLFELINHNNPSTSTLL